MSRATSPGSDEALLSVGAVARRSGVATSALRFYETKGLLHSQRSAGGQRQYRREVLRRVAVIKVAQRIGIPLADVMDAFSALPDKRAPSPAEWRKLSARWRGQLNARIEQMVKMRDQLDECIGCGCLSLKTCPLRNPNDVAAQAGPGARMFDID